MNQTARLRKSGNQFRALTGITPEKFDGLLGLLTPLFAEADHKRLSSPERKRAVGAGRRYRTSLADRLLMLLIYYRTYVTHEFIGFLFGVDDSTVSRHIRPIEPLLAKIFRIPERKVRLTEDEIAEIFFDGTEQRIQRPGKKQGKWYSGRKKTHTVKHQVVTVRGKKKPGPGKGKKRKVRIASVSKAFRGRIHDKAIYDRVRVIPPPGTRKTADSGYRGTCLTTPHKKPRGGELTGRQKKANRKLSSLRVSVEHGIGKMKIWRIAADRYRNALKKHTLMFRNVAGLQNMMFA